MMATSKLQLAVFSRISSAWHSTDIVPVSKFDPDDGEQMSSTVLPRSFSTVGALHVTGIGTFSVAKL